MRHNNFFLGAQRGPKTLCWKSLCAFLCPLVNPVNLEIVFRFRFRNGKANKFPQIFFRIFFRNEHVGYTQATTAGQTYDIN